jgi:hypothetical protein
VTNRNPCGESQHVQHTLLSILAFIGACTTPGPVPFSCAPQTSTPAPIHEPRPALPGPITAHMDALEALAVDALARCETLIDLHPSRPCLAYFMPAERPYHDVEGFPYVTATPPGAGSGLIALEARCAYPADALIERRPEFEGENLVAGIPMQYLTCAYRPWGQLPAVEGWPDQALVARWRPRPRSEITVYGPAPEEGDEQWLQVWIKLARPSGVNVHLVATYQGRDYRPRDPNTVDDEVEDPAGPQ